MPVNFSQFYLQQSSRKLLTMPGGSLGRARSSSGTEQGIFSEAVAQRKSRLDGLADAASGKLTSLRKTRDAVDAIKASVGDLRSALGSGSDVTPAQTAVRGTRTRFALRDVFEQRAVYESRDVTGTRATFGTREITGVRDLFETLDLFGTRDVFGMRDVTGVRDVFETRDITETRDVMGTRDVTEQRAVYEMRDVLQTSVTGTRRIDYSSYEGWDDAGIRSGDKITLRVGTGQNATLEFRSNEEIDVVVGGVRTKFHFEDDDGAWRTGLLSALNSIAGLDASINSAGKLSLATENAETLTLSNAKGNALSDFGLSAGTISARKVGEVQVQTSTETVVIGQEQVKVGEETVVTGRGPVKVGEETVVIGQEQVKLDEETVLIGQEHVKVGEEVVVLGEETVVTGEETVVIGQEMTYVGEQRRRVGTERVAVGTETVVLGYRSAAGSSAAPADHAAISRALGDIDRAASSVALDGSAAAALTVAGLGLSQVRAMANGRREDALLALHEAEQKITRLSESLAIDLQMEEVQTSFDGAMKALLASGTTADVDEERAITLARSTARSLSFLDIQGLLGRRDGESTSLGRLLTAQL